MSDPPLHCHTSKEDDDVKTLISVFVALSANGALLESPDGGGLFKSPSLRSSTWGAQGTRDAGRIMDPGEPGAQLCCSSGFVGLASMAQYK